MELVKYDAAKRAIAEAASVDEVKKIHDMSTAMKAYARQANDRDMEVKAAEIRIRAERRLGEMLRAQKEAGGMATASPGNQYTGPVPKENRSTPTLAEVGIDKKLSARAQQIAAIPEPEFEHTLNDHREQQQAITNATMQRLTEQGKEAERKGILQKPDGMSSTDFQRGMSIAGHMKTAQDMFNGDPRSAARAVAGVGRVGVFPTSESLSQWFTDFVDELRSFYVSR